MFRGIDSSLNSNNDSFLSTSSENITVNTRTKSNKDLDLSQKSKGVERNIVNHFLLKSQMKSFKTIQSKPNIKQEFNNNKGHISNDNSGAQSKNHVQFSYPLEVASSLAVSTKIHNTKPSKEESKFLKRTTNNKTKFANFTPLIKAEVVRTSSFRHSNQSNLKSYLISNTNSISSKNEECKSLENITALKEEVSYINNTHSINRLIKMASNWNMKSRSSSTSSNYPNPSLVSQSNIKTTNSFINDEHGTANTETSLSKNLAEFEDKPSKNYQNNEGYIHKNENKQLKLNRSQSTIQIKADNRKNNSVLKSTQVLSDEDDDLENYFFNNEINFFKNQPKNSKDAYLNFSKSIKLVNIDNNMSSKKFLKNKFNLNELRKFQTKKQQIMIET